MSKIARIEDVTNIVGIKNYIAALALNKQNLTYIGYEKNHKGITFKFIYNDLSIQICVDKKKNIYNMHCNCGMSDDYCPHVALAVMYLLTHEDTIEEGLETLNEEYDSYFNERLLKELSSKYIKRAHWLRYYFKRFGGLLRVRIRIENKNRNTQKICNE